MKKSEARLVKRKERAMRRCSKVVLMWITTLGTLAFAPPAFAQEFALQVGPPIAGKGQPAKSSLLVVRPGGCAEPASAHITATAEGIVQGTRRSVPLTLVAMPTPGVHAVPRDWARGGVWIVTLAGTCAGKTAGAIVPVGPNAMFRRQDVTLLAHRPTPAEIDASLKALTTGGQK
jgi:hypothetical protein